MSENEIIPRAAAIDFMGKDMARVIRKLNAEADPTPPEEGRAVHEITASMVTYLGREQFKEAYRQLLWKLEQMAKSRKLTVFDGRVVACQEPDCAIRGDMVTVILRGYKNHDSNAKGGKLQEMLDAGRAPTAFVHGRSGLL